MDLTSNHYLQPTSRIPEAMPPHLDQSYVLVLINRRDILVNPGVSINGEEIHDQLSEQFLR